MNRTRITRYVETSTRITSKVEMGVLQPEPLYPEWTNFVSQKSVKAIAIAPKSQQIWMATWGGVLSWNRKEEFLYRRYSSESGLAGNAITCLCLDQDENPWTGHAEGGLSYFSAGHWQVYSHLQTAPIRAIVSAVHRKGIWVATADTIYYVADPESNPVPVARESNGAVEAVTLLADGENLLVGNRLGLFRVQWDREPEAIAPNLLDNCSALTRDGNGNIWVGTHDGLYQLSGEHSNQHDPRKIITSILPVIALAAGKKRVWVLTAAGLAQVADGQYLQVPWRSESGKPLFIQAIAASTDDTYLWVGTERRLAGVRSTNADNTTWDLDLLPPHRDDELHNLGRRTILSDTQERVWVGTAGGVIAFDLDNEWRIWANHNDVRSLSVISSNDKSTTKEMLWILAWPQGIGNLNFSTGPNFPKLKLPGLPTLLSAGNDGCPYIITGSALWRLRGDQLTKIAPGVSGLPRCLLQTPDSVWWLGTVRGLYRLASGRWKFVGAQPGPLQAEVYALVVADNTLWVATEIGLWERQNEDWILHNPGQQNSSRAVWALAAGRLGTLWMASAEGVCCYNPKTKMQGVSYTAFNSGLGSRRVTALLETPGFLWIVTQVGISRLTLDEGEKNGAE